MKIVASPKGPHVTMVSFNASDSRSEMRWVFEHLLHRFANTRHPRPECSLGGVKLSPDRIVRFLDEEGLRGSEPMGKRVILVEFDTTLPTHRFFYNFVELNHEMDAVFRAPPKEG